MGALLAVTCVEPSEIHNTRIRQTTQRALSVSTHGDYLRRTLHSKPLRGRLLVHFWLTSYECWETCGVEGNELWIWVWERTKLHVPTKLKLCEHRCRGNEFCTCPSEPSCHASQACNHGWRVLGVSGLKREHRPRAQTAFKGLSQSLRRGSSLTREPVDFSLALEALGDGGGSGGSCM